MAGMVAENTGRAVREKEPSLIDHIRARVAEMEAEGSIQLPPNYSIPNALQAAEHVLTQRDQGGRSVLDQVTDKASVAFALRYMIEMGLNPGKDQCYFIPRGGKLTLQRSYFGDMAIAKRIDPRIEDITAEVVYEGERVKIARRMGHQVVEEHDYDFATRGSGRIVAAYCDVVYKDGRVHSTFMTMEEIERSWKSGGAAMNGKAHKFTPGEMAKRTVIRKACKPIIQSSDDGMLLAAVGRSEMDAEHACQTEAIQRGTACTMVAFDAGPARPARKISEAPASAPAGIPAPAEEQPDVVAARDAGEPDPPEPVPVEIVQATMPMEGLEDVEVPF